MTMTMATARWATACQAMSNKVNNDSDGATGDGAMGYDDNDGNDGGTMGNEVDYYGEGAKGDDDDDDNNNGDGTERRNNQIEAMVAAGGNNSHWCSTVESDNDEDDDNRSRQDCVTGMWALRRGMSTITTIPMWRCLQVGLRRQ